MMISLVYPCSFTVRDFQLISRWIGLNQDLSEEDESKVNVNSKGKGKKLTETKDRKAQNRVAQREFRQRKVQYVKDLEARVALLESSKDDQTDSYRVGIKAL